MASSRLLIGCPTSYHKRYCLKTYLDGLRKLTYPNADFIIVDNSEDEVYFFEIKNHVRDMKNFSVEKGPWFEGAKDRIVASRNMIREIAIAKGYDYYLSLEQDVVFCDPDAVQRMVKHAKDIVAGVVIGDQQVHGAWKPAPMVYVDSEVDKEKMWFLSQNIVKKRELVEVRATALGCVLISKAVLEKIKFRYEVGFDDMMFSLDSRNAGFKIYCDCSIHTEHHQRPGAWDGIKK